MWKNYITTQNQRHNKGIKIIIEELHQRTPFGIKPPKNSDTLLKAVEHRV